MLIAVLIAITVFQFAIISLIFIRQSKAHESKSVKSSNTPASVSQFYNENTGKFLAVYGEIIQAFRTTNINDYLQYTIQSAALKNDMKIIDAGCGVAGPACFFAKNLPGLFIDSCTVSKVQADLASIKVQENKVDTQVKITLGDYHQLDELFENDQYDRVIFLESFGHSNNKTKLIDACWKVLKPGGKMYIKDLFIRESNNEWEQLRINHICSQINQAYEYQVGDLNDVLSTIRKQGFIVNFIRPPQVDTGLFEHLTISNDFQNLFNIGKIDSWEDYVFPIDFFEILVEKPLHNIEDQKHLYFMNR
ncbi:MAG: class I SAM-dependent methyltransferase [Chitinophagales bacterium]